MNIILFTKYIGSPLTLRMGHSRFYVISLALILMVCTGLFYAGFWLGQAQTLNIADGSQIAGEKQKIVYLKKKLESNREAAKTYLAALAQQIGTLKSHVIRLDALGQRLTSMANLDPQEFNFTRPPAQGGPNRSGGISQNINIPNFLREMTSLSALLRDREVSLGVLETQIMTHKLEQKVEPKGRPVKAGYVSSSYGARRDPINGRRTYHDGIDYAARSGTPIFAVAAGIVTSAGPRAGYGYLVEINHGKYLTRYAHNKKNLVTIGQKVAKGQKIALVGSTGRSTGPHVHFEIISRKKGRTINPVPFVKGQRQVKR